MAQLNFSQESLDLADLLDVRASLDNSEFPDPCVNPENELPSDPDVVPQPDSFRDVFLNTSFDDDATDHVGSSIDLCDGFYQFLAPEIASYFGLGDVFFPPLRFAKYLVKLPFLFLTKKLKSLKVFRMKRYLKFVSVVWRWAGRGRSTFATTRSPTPSGLR